MKILNIHPNVEEVYYEEAFLHLLETHMTFLKTSGGGHILPVSNLQKGKYEGDFFGLLDDLKIDKKYHYVVMRFNGLSSSADYVGTSDTILVPDYSVVDNLKNVYESREI